MASDPRPVLSFRDLDVWRVAMELAVDVYTLSRSFPGEERFLLTAQLRKAAISVPSNIAEGHGRFGPTEFRHGVSVARGSLAELDTQLELAGRLAFARVDQFVRTREPIDHLSRMLTNLYRRLS